MKSGKEFRNEEVWRASFPCDGRWGISRVKKQELVEGPIELVSYADTRTRDLDVNTRKGVHFFIDDPRFEGVYRNYERPMAKLSQYRFLLTPDNSIYADMKPWRQLRSVGESRWCGAYWQSRGLTVYPTVSWGLPQTYEFCFSGIERHSTVAIATYACRAGKRLYLSGYREMIRVLDPDHIICLGEPFPEMREVDIVVNEHSARRTVR